MSPQKHRFTMNRNDFLRCAAIFALNTWGWIDDTGASFKCTDKHDTHPEYCGTASPQR